jgi:hypothetical protein
MENTVRSVMRTGDSQKHAVSTLLIGVIPQSAFNQLYGGFKGATVNLP